jgi:3-oxoacyl-[acyl-carrier-protein] synthase-3
MSVPTLKQAPVQEHSRILGLGAYRPDVIVTNEDVCQWIDSSDEWIRQRTGIVTRHRAAADVSVIDMAEGAARPWRRPVLRPRSSGPSLFPR